MITTPPTPAPTSVRELAEFLWEQSPGHFDGALSKILVSAGDAIVVPAGLRHNLTNIGKKRLCLYTIYAPPNHAKPLMDARTSAGPAEEGRKEMINEGSPVQTP